MTCCLRPQCRVSLDGPDLPTDICSGKRVHTIAARTGDGASVTPLHRGCEMKENRFSSAYQRTRLERSFARGAPEAVNYSPPF